MNNQQALNTSRVKNSKEMICDEFYKNFSKYKDEKLVIYGIGLMTKEVLDRFPEFNIIALMDETRAGERIYGKPILSEEEVAKEDVKKIIIIATANNTNIIYNRIARFSIENKIDVFNIEGELLPLNKGLKKDFDKYSNVSFENLKDKIEKADVVSFDVFDTLIMRKTLYPRDIFHIVEKRAKIKGFYNIRIKAEMECAGGNLLKIYEGVAENLNLSQRERDDLMRLEIDTEREFITPRESMVDALKYALNSNKQVYFVSDMYLPNEIMHEILILNNISLEKDKILVSCDYGVGKSNGLFDVLRNMVGNQSILHIGDNIDVDIISAERYGIDDTFLLHSAYEMLFDSNMSELLTYTKKLSDRIMMGRFIAMQLNDPFLFAKTNGKLLIEDNFKLGYSFFAPMIAGYILWLKNMVQAEKFDCIFLTSRDGWLIKKIIEQNEYLKEHFPKLIYFYTSRKIAYRCIINSEDDILEVLKIPFAGEYSKRLKLNFKLDDNEILEYKGESEEEYILKHKDAIFQKAAITKQRFLNYIKKLNLKPDAKIGYMDFTSSGTTQLGLESVTNFDVKGLYFMCYEPRDFLERKSSLKIDTFLGCQSIYLFNSKFLNYYVELENILTSFEATVDDFSEDGTPIFSDDKRSPIFMEIIKEIHESIFEYIYNFDLSLMEDCTNSIPELIFSYMHQDYSIHKASYYEHNDLFDDVPNRYMKVMGNSTH